MVYPSVGPKSVYSCSFSYECLCFEQRKTLPPITCCKEARASIRRKNRLAPSQSAMAESFVVGLFAKDGAGKERLRAFPCDMEYGFVRSARRGAYEADHCVVSPWAKWHASPCKQYPRFQYLHSICFRDPMARGGGRASFCSEPIPGSSPACAAYSRVFLTLYLFWFPMHS